VIVEGARARRHPLHRYFEWDDGIAAEQWRRKQAMDMMLSVRILQVMKEAGKRPPTPITTVAIRDLLPGPGPLGSGFVERSKVLSDEDTRGRFVERKLGELLSWCRSVCDVDELREIRETIEQLISVDSE
jgi:hypothetical protein